QGRKRNKEALRNATHISFDSAMVYPMPNKWTKKYPTTKSNTLFLFKVIMCCLRDGISNNCAKTPIKIIINVILANAVETHPTIIKTTILSWITVDNQVFALDVTQAVCSNVLAERITLFDLLNSMTRIKINS